MYLKSVSIPKYTGNKEITCYKVLNNNFTSMYKGFPYDLHKLYNTRITFAIKTRLPDRYFISLGNILRYEFPFEMQPHYYKNYHEDSFWHNMHVCCDCCLRRFNDLILEGFHSFKEFDDTKILYNVCKNIIVKCHIPKYTWYYEGIDSSTNFSAYVSESIILDEIINIC